MVIKNLYLYMYIPVYKKKVNADNQPINEAEPKLNGPKLLLRLFETFARIETCLHLQH